MIYYTSEDYKKVKHEAGNLSFNSNHDRKYQHTKQEKLEHNDMQSRSMQIIN